MIDRDLAELYGVTTGVLIQAVNRNRDRFPGDFMFQLASQELANLKSQIVISSSAWGGRRTVPYAFTQEGVAVLSGVLKSKRAVAINIQIMRAFVRMRDMLETNGKLAAKLKEIEDRLDMNDQNVVTIMHALREHLRQPPPQPRKRSDSMLTEPSAVFVLRSPGVSPAIQPCETVKVCWTLVRQF